jgi:membrane associated rhomboid family serine protease
VQLFACAFCGEVQLVEQLLSGCLNLYPIHIKNFWRAIARYAAGEKAIAAQILTELLENPDANFRQAIRLYLNNPPWVAKKRLQPESFPLIAELTREIKEEKIDRPYQSLLDYRPFYKQGFSINLLLILVNSLVFVGGLLFDLKFGSNAFIDLGAFIPKNVWAGEWWRIFTATFLHISWGHLLTNMLTLYLLGNFVEKHLGKWRYLLVYLCSGIGAMLLILVAVTLTRDLNFNLLPNWTNFLTNEIRYDDREWVGASGSIMGMIGAIAIILWRGWSRKQSQSALRQFRLIVGISCLQFAIDLSSTNVSFYSHFWGLILGIVLTLKLTEKPFKTLKNCSIK